MKPSTRQALDRPSAERWHDGAVVIDAAEAVHRLAGDAGVEAMNAAAVKQSLGPILAPFLKVTIALFGGAPDSILKRMNDSLRNVMDGVRSEWSSTGPKSGRLVISYPDEVMPVAWPCWKGSLSYIYELCGTEGVVVAQADAATSRTIVFDCSWK